MIALEITESYQSQVDLDLVEQAVNTTLVHQNAHQASDLTVVITNDEQLHELNRQFLDIDAPTDVLSFPADFTDPDNETPYLGDILISFPRAALQASTAGHAVMEEIQLLVVHGVLHLLGCDHDEPSEKAKMWRVQSEILQQLGLGNIKIPEGDH
jgi:probable rRNA maturation factor